jgi:hypothetical protein
VEESQETDFLQFAHNCGELVLQEKEEEEEEEEEDGGEGGRGNDLGMLEATDLKIGFSKHSLMVGRESNN